MTNKEYKRLTLDETFMDPDELYGTHGTMRRLYDLETAIEKNELVFVQDSELKQLQEKVAELNQLLQIMQLENLSLKNKSRGYENESKKK